MNVSKRIPNTFRCSARNPDFKTFLNYLIQILQPVIETGKEANAVDAAFQTFSTSFEKVLPENNPNLSSIDYHLLFVGEFAPECRRLYKQLLEVWINIQNHFLPEELGLSDSGQKEYNRNTIPGKMAEIKESLEKLQRKVTPAQP
ncbi:MAG: hypothetical protein ACOX6V_00775 [Patescibacteria group bacterium]|jgi:hypothetical protein